MIIFYDKQTGKIQGTIEGRVHGEDHLKMWVGSEDDNARLVIQWVLSGYLNGKDEPITKEEAMELSKAKLIVKTVFSPDHPQKEFLADLEKRVVNLYDFKIDPKTKQFIAV